MAAGSMSIYTLEIIAILQIAGEPGIAAHAGT